MSQNFKLNILLSLYTASIVVVNLMGGKIITLLDTNILGFHINIQQSIAIFIIAIPFLISEVVQEIYGKKISQQFLVSGLISLFATLIFTFIAIHIAPAPRYSTNTEYVTIFDTSYRFIIASLVAFAISLFSDIWLFKIIKNKISSFVGLWLRSDLASALGIFMDTVIFMFIAFYLAYPGYDFWFVWNITWPYYIYKLILTWFDTPLVYLGTIWLSKNYDSKSI